MAEDYLALIQALGARVERVAALLGVDAPGAGLPVVSVPGVCAVEVSAEGLLVLTRMSREKALSFDFSRLRGREYEAYGANCLTEDLFTSRDSEKTIHRVLNANREKEICFSFSAREEEISDFVRFLQEEGAFEAK